jgi:hypothetical protein
LEDRVAEHGEELRDLDGAGAPCSEIFLEPPQAEARLNDSDPPDNRRLSAADRHSIPTWNESQQHLQLAKSALDQDCPRVLPALQSSPEVSPQPAIRWPPAALDGLRRHDLEISDPDAWGRAASKLRMPEINRYLTRRESLDHDIVRDLS